MHHPIRVSARIERLETRIHGRHQERERFAVLVTHLHDSIDRADVEDAGAHRHYDRVGEHNTVFNEVHV